LLKVTVPKRTGRKRKRGSNGPWKEAAAAESIITLGDSADVTTNANNTNPAHLRRTMQDNVGNYDTEVLGLITHTHRYRAFADFQFALGRSDFTNRLVNRALSGDVAKMREYKFKPGLDGKTDVDLMPPPFVAPSGLATLYSYSDNPLIRKTAKDDEDGSDSASEPGSKRNVMSTRRSAGHFLTFDQFPAPTAPKRQTKRSTAMEQALDFFDKALAERPIWTRRSIVNHLLTTTNISASETLIKKCIHLVGYQFRGGPFRDCLIKYGIDPRLDPQYARYQTMGFQLDHRGRSRRESQWREKHHEATDPARSMEWHGPDRGRNTHIFDGHSYSSDGRIWQVCDITDPVLVGLFARLKPRAECDIEISGWYHRMPWAAAKGIMKLKMTGIRFNKALPDSAYKDAANVPDIDPGPGQNVQVPLPEIRLSEAEMVEITGRTAAQTGKRMSKRRARNAGVFRVWANGKKQDDGGSIRLDRRMESLRDDANTEFSTVETFDDEDEQGSPSRQLQDGMTGQKQGLVNLNGRTRNAANILEHLDSSEDGTEEEDEEGEEEVDEEEEDEGDEEGEEEKDDNVDEDEEGDVAEEDASHIGSDEGNEGNPEDEYDND
jgi:general transcription factor 3C polypeptide 5 (transcription factor C subunit 1)